MQKTLANQSRDFIEHGEYGILLLDLDGTIVRSEELHAQVGAEVISANGVPMTPAQRILYKGYGEAKLYDHLERIGTPLRISKADFISAHAKAYLEHLKKVQNPRDIVRPWVVGLIDQFAESGKPIAIVSNTTREIVHTTLAAAGLQDKINLVLSYDDMTEKRLRTKPEPDGWLSALHRFSPDFCQSARGQRALLIGDGPNDILSARAANAFLNKNCNLQGRNRNPIDSIQIYYDEILNAGNSNELPNPMATYAVRDRANDGEISNLFNRAVNIRPGHIIDEYLAEHSSFLGFTFERIPA